MMEPREVASSVLGAVATAVIGFVGWLGHRFIRGIDNTSATATLAVKLIEKVDSSSTRAHERLAEVWRELEKLEAENQKIRDRISRLEGVDENRKAV